MKTKVDLHPTPPARNYALARGLGVVALTWPWLMTLASAAAFQNQLANWEGRIQQVTRDGLKATLDTGETSIRLSKGAQSVRNGFTTAVLVTGSDRVSVLKPGVYVRFECDLNDQGQPVGTILKIDAREEPYPELGIFPAATPAGPAAEAAPETQTKPPTARVEIVGELRKVDLGRRAIDVWYPKTNMPTTPRRPFPIDPEATRVDFAFVDLAYAKPNDLVVVRGFMSDDDASIMATEIRARRVDVFPPNDSDGAQLDPLAAAPAPVLATETPAAEEAEPGESDPAELLAAEDSELPGDLGQTDSMIPPGRSESADVEVFEFPKNLPPKTAEEKARRHYKIN